MTPVSLSNISNIRNITVSGRIGSGTTTLAKGLSRALEWKLLEGGAIFERIHKEHLNDITELAVNNRPDSFDLDYEEKIKRILREEKHNVIQSHLAGFDAQGIEGVFKVLILCEDDEGNDKPDIRIDRLVNRRKISIEEAKQDILIREARNLEKWRRLYAQSDQDWIYWDKKYYDLVINTYDHNQEETLKIALEGIGFRSAK